VPVSWVVLAVALGDDAGLDGDALFLGHVHGRIGVGLQVDKFGAAEHADKLRSSLQDSVAEDSAAFDEVMDAFKLPKTTEEEKSARQTTIQEATLHAAQVPLRVARYIVDVLQLARLMVEKGNSNAITDAGTAAALAKSALSGASMNVLINLEALDDPREVEQIKEQLHSCQTQASELLDAIDQLIQVRGQITGYTL